jgi:hypothetical protein
MPLSLSTLAILSLALVPTAQSRRAKEEIVPPLGWYAQPATKKDPGWLAACYFPPVWDELQKAERSMARQAALQAMKSQWLGDRDDVVAFERSIIEGVENTLFGRPEQIEAVSDTNAQHCLDVVASGASVDAWQRWLSEITALSRQDECATPLDYQLVQYLKVDSGWQEQVPMCKGDRAGFSVSVNDLFRISADGAWLNAAGDADRAATESSLPCNWEGCLSGMLIGRFVTEQGIETVFPIGTQRVFEAPEQGFLSFAINDDSWADNEWRSNGTVTDHAAVTISPVDRVAD